MRLLTLIVLVFTAILCGDSSANGIIVEAFVFVPWMAFAAVSAISAGVSGYASYQQGESQKAMADYNAKVAENEALAAQQAIDVEQRELTKGQREMKARQRMSIASRGGMEAGTDLMSLAEQAKEMQLDQLELQRQQDLAGIRGASEAAMSRYQGRTARSAGRWTAGSKLLSGAASAYSMYGSGGGSSGGTFKGSSSHAATAKSQYAAYTKGLGR